MKKKILKSISYIAVITLISLNVYSCKDIFDLEPGDVLDGDKMYQNKFDADGAVLGIYGKLMNVAEQYVLWNELRADLMEVADNADGYLQQLNHHDVSSDNPYINPKPFYEIILSCNDVIANFKKMHKEHKLDVNNYNQMYSDVVAVRSWLYLQLGIHFGSVPYVTDPLVTINDVKNPANFPILGLNELIVALIQDMEAIPFKGQYPVDNTLMSTIDGYRPDKLYINKRYLLGDLYLWNNDYVNAAINYKEVMKTGNTFSGDAYYNMYRINWADVANNNDVAIGYVRYREQDINMLINSNTQGWRSMFARSQDNLYNWEWINCIHFDSRFEPKYPFVDLFSNTNGKYLLRPSKESMDNWNRQIQNNSFPFDARGMLSWREVNGQPVIMKYLYARDQNNPLNVQGRWFIARAASLHLRFAEAANRDQRHNLSWALLNTGIKGAFDYWPDSVDQTLKQATFDVPPYDFDARMGNTPYFRDTWHRNNGIRGRAYVRALAVQPDLVIDLEDTINYENQWTVLNYNDSIICLTNGLSEFIETKLIEESALELAFEGYRWPDLLRIAIRRNDPAFLADKIYSKLHKAGYPGASAVRDKLMRKEWFLPMNWD